MISSEPMSRLRRPSRYSIVTTWPGAIVRTELAPAAMRAASMFAAVAGSPMKTCAGTGLHAASAEGVLTQAERAMAPPRAARSGSRIVNGPSGKEKGASPKAGPSSLT